MRFDSHFIGEFATLFDERCGISDLTPFDVSGVNSSKEFFEPSNQVGADTSKYKNVPDGFFACNLMHVGRDVVLPIAMNHSGKTKVVSPAYSVFSFNGHGIVLPEYFFMFLKSKERDRYFWFHTDASVRDGMSWQDFCELEIQLPPVEVQRKYVAIYNGLHENQRCYERGLDDLKLVCDGYIEDLRKKYPLQRLEPYICEVDERNGDRLGLDSVRGISIEKKFIDTKANMEGVSLSPYKVVRPNRFAYVPVTSRNGEKITLALNSSNEDYVVSSSYIVFGVRDSQMLDPGYLFMLFSRSEFDRYSRFNSWGSARETFNWEDMQDVRIPIPDISIQRSISDVYRVYLERKRINEQLKTQLKDICPILIKGSLEEAAR